MIMPSLSTNKYKNHYLFKYIWLTKLICIISLTFYSMEELIEDKRFALLWIIGIGLYQ